MPIRQLKPQRPGTKPVVFFKGSITEASRTPLKDIRAALETAGVEFFSPRHANKVSSRFRSHIVNNMRVLKGQYLSAKTTSFDLPDGTVELRLKKLGPNTFSLQQQAMVHGVGYAREVTTNVYGDLHSILSGRLKLIGEGPNVATKDMAERGSTYFAQSHPPYGDAYALHITAPMRSYAGGLGTVEEATREQISKLVITLSPKLSDKQRKERSSFYREELKKYGIPLKFI